MVSDGPAGRSVKETDAHPYRRAGLCRCEDANRERDYKERSWRHWRRCGVRQRWWHAYNADGQKGRRRLYALCRRHSDGAGSSDREDPSTRGSSKAVKLGADKRVRRSFTEDVPEGEMRCEECSWLSAAS